jgi:hypothetical protein
LLESSAAMSLAEMQATLRRDLERDAEPERPRAAPPPPAETPREPDPASAATTRTRVELGVGYGSQWTGPELGLLHGPGARFGIERNVGGGSLFATFGFLQGFEQEYESSLLVVVVRSSVLRLLSGGALELGSGAELALALGGGVDLQRVTPRAMPGGYTLLAEPSSDTTPWLRAEVGPRWRAAPLSAFLSVTGDLSPSRTHYDVAGAVGTQTLFETWRARPGVLLGVAWYGDLD